jgi:F-type H+-transporting ATPase subunit delta
MAGTRAAIRYAKAILDIAKENNSVDAVNTDMASIVNAIKESTELKDFLQSPIIKGEIKHSSLNEIFASAQKETKGLFQLLLANKRFELLNDVALQYNALYDELNGIEVAKVTTAVPMTSELEAKVLSKIASFSNKKITIQNIVDPTIIGGFILRMGDQQYNASVANSLQNLKREFSN